MTQEPPAGWRETYNELMDVEKHYQRKEHAFFPFLERHGITGPSKVMWAKDDEVRALLKKLGEALAGAPPATAASAAEAALSAVEEMMYKEDNILLPMCLDRFTEDEWGEIWASSPRYGWCLVEPQQGYRPPDAAVRESLRLAATEAVQLPTGNLTIEQLVGIFSTLPVDLTFVDADDRVAFFSEGPDRVFARSKAIIGRKVQHCHPPRSVDIVDRIVTDFREGRQNVAEFWITLDGKFVHIRYFAVRDSQNRYLGTLEVTQDLTRVRAPGRRTPPARLRADSPDLERAARAAMPAVPPAAPHEFGSRVTTPPTFFSSLILLLLPAFAAVSRRGFPQPSCNHENGGGGMNHWPCGNCFDRFAPFSACTQAAVAPEALQFQ